MKNSFQLYLVVKKQVTELRAFTQKINRANYFIKNAHNVKMLSQFFPQLSSVKNASEILIKQMKLLQQVALISFQKKQLEWQRKKWAKSLCFYTTPYVTSNPLLFVREKNETVKLKEPKWKCQYYQDKMLIEIAYQMNNATTAKLQLQSHVKDWLF
ncbi:MAG: hypothetical protein JNM93_13900 [Bacteriovoracaceae bacterium]|nr:hypothetical protein [Bacteriovoracaceae bacterium]